ncbi:sulfatase-like hydrolase/transferase [bacterium]|nr:sulfatase-like hydrolase/transferase [bacterium]
MRHGLLLALIGSLVVASGSSIASAKAPNILFIVVDDQSPLDLRVYNPQTTLETPQIDRLGASGMVLDAAYHMGSFSGAVCTPSRHMIMTGRTVWHLPIGVGSARHCPADIEQSTLPAVFNQAGYKTMRTCKQGNSYPGANKQFQVVHDATKRGPTAESGSAWHAEQVLNFLKDRAAAKEEAPFLIYYGFSHPHDERDGTPELLEKYGAINYTNRSQPPPLDAHQPPLPAEYLPAHPFPHGHPQLRDEVDVSGVWERRDPATIHNEIGRHHACSENIDIQIGRVLDQLREMGELDNTYIVYTSDHGIAIGRHGLQGKQNLYEHTWRVPMIVSGPGIQPGSRAAGNVYLLDVLATLCDLAEIAAPESNEGLSFKPVLMGQTPVVRDVMYGVYCGGTKPGMRSVRRGDWKLIEYDVLDGQVRQTQLFNLAENPHEFLPQHHDPELQKLVGTSPLPQQTNLADDPRYASELKLMRDLLLAEMRRVDDPFRLWNQPDDGLPAVAPPVKPRPNKPAAAKK